MYYQCLKECLCVLPALWTVVHKLNFIKALLKPGYLGINNKMLDLYT